MKRKRAIIVFLLGVLLITGAFAWRFTRGNAGWQIRQVFPGAQPYFSPSYSPDPSISATIRYFVPSYFGEDESVGFSLTDSSELLDLHARFSRLFHLRFYSIRLTRCKIINLRDLDSAGFHGFILFDDCDFSELPAEQRALIRRYDPTNPAATKQFCIGTV
ncbi:MAG: hypothetical protein ABIP85_26745 [Chthoniobacteraceae bacterium]